MKYLILLQIFISDILLLQFATYLSLLVLYMSLENPNEDDDKLLGIYNRRGFEKVVKSAIEVEERFHLLVIRRFSAKPSSSTDVRA